MVIITKQLNCAGHSWSHIDQELWGFGFIWICGGSSKGDGIMGLVKHILLFSFRLMDVFSWVPVVGHPSSAHEICNRALSK